MIGSASSDKVRKIGPEVRFNCFFFILFLLKMVKYHYYNTENAF